MPSVLVSTEHRPPRGMDRDGGSYIQHRAWYTVGAQQLSHLLRELGSGVSKGQSFGSPQRSSPTVLHNFWTDHGRIMKVHYAQRHPGRTVLKLEAGQ